MEWKIVGIIAAVCTTTGFIIDSLPYVRVRLHTRQTINRLSV